MPKYFIFFFFFFQYPNLLQAQPSSAVPVMEAVNGKIAAIKQGYFDCTYRWKSATKSDTSSRSARIYFFKNDNELDSICPFVIMRDGELREAFDGTYFYSLGKNKSIRASLVSESGGVGKMLRKNYLDFLVFRPYVLQKEAFKSSKFKQAILDTFETTNGKAVRISVLDSFKNDLKLLPTDPEMAQVKEVYEVMLSDTFLFRKQEIITFLSSPQYLENKVSPITALPDSSSFEQIFNLPLLQSEGYEFTTRPRTRAVQVPQSNIQAGDTLPGFKLINLDGEAFNSIKCSTEFLLLDFWYLGCAPCIKAMPMLERLHQKYGGRALTVLGINAHDKNAADIKSFLQERSVSYQTLLDPEKTMAKDLGISGYPTVVLVNVSTHQVLMVHIGFSEDAEGEIEGFLKG